MQNDHQPEHTDSARKHKRKFCRCRFCFRAAYAIPISRWTGERGAQRGSPSSLAAARPTHPPRAGRGARRGRQRLPLLCPQTASQWIRSILGDALTYRSSGLAAYHYQSHAPGAADTRRITERTFNAPFPEGRIVSPIYVDYVNYAAFPKPLRYRTFCVARDPRDIVVSWYFSAKFSYRPMGELANKRGQLLELPTEDGLLVVIDYLADFGLFDALGSWTAAKDDPHAILVKFEDLVGEASRQTFADLFEHLTIPLPATDLDDLLERYSFERLSGRARGNEDARSHYRKGTPGDWKNHFTPRVTDRLQAVAPDLAERLGYEPGF